MKKLRCWMVVSHNINDWGTWIFHTRKEAIQRKREMLEFGDGGDVELYYGYFSDSKENFKSSPQ